MQTCRHRLCNLQALNSIDLVCMKDVTSVSTKLGSRIVFVGFDFERFYSDPGNSQTYMVLIVMYIIMYTLACSMQNSLQVFLCHEAGPVMP